MVDQYYSVVNERLTATRQSRGRVVNFAELIGLSLENIESVSTHDGMHADGA